MSRYINIDDISLRKTISVGGLSAKALWKRIQQEPNIDIVRCKECKYWIGHIADDDGFDGEDECRWRDSEAPNADDYCSYGERKESE